MTTTTPSSAISPLQLLHRFIWFGGVGFLLLASFLLLRFSPTVLAQRSQKAPLSTAPPTPLTQNNQTVPSDDTFTQLLVQTNDYWANEYYGTRYMKMNPDGTGQMICLVDSSYRWLVGKRLNLSLNWEYDQGKFSFTLTEVTPSQHWGIVKNMWGLEHHLQVLHYTDEALTLQDQNGEQHLWEKVQKTPSKSAQIPKVVF